MVKFFNKKKNGNKKVSELLSQQEQAQVAEFAQRIIDSKEKTEPNQEEGLPIKDLVKPERTPEVVLLTYEQATVISKDNWEDASIPDGRNQSQIVGFLVRETDNNFLVAKQRIKDKYNDIHSIPKTAITQNWDGPGKPWISISGSRRKRRAIVSNCPKRQLIYE